jgi:hypothetical protein
MRVNMHVYKACLFGYVTYQCCRVSCVAGRRIELQPGAVPLLHRARRAGVATHVVSVSWSAEMLRGALCGRIPLAPGCGLPPLHAGLSWGLPETLVRQATLLSEVAARQRVSLSYS